MGGRGVRARPVPTADPHPHIQAACDSQGSGRGAYSQQCGPKELRLETASLKSVLMRWMKLEPIIQNEVSQKEKHQYSILTHIYGI